MHCTLASVHTGRTLGRPKAADLARRGWLPEVLLERVSLRRPADASSLELLRQELGRGDMWGRTFDCFVRVYLTGQLREVEKHSVMKCDQNAINMISGSGPLLQKMGVAGRCLLFPEDIGR